MVGCMLLSQGLKEAGTLCNSPFLSHEEERRNRKMAVSIWMPEGSFSAPGTTVTPTA